MGLKKVGGNHEVSCVQQELDTWNIDGSSVNKPGVGSWIKFWEQSTGRPRGRCAYSDCPKQAEHGGHVWITGGYSSVPREICWIVPICAECNSPLNERRMQNSEGNHSRLRVGSLVVKTKYTFEMRTAQRRIATDDYELMENDSFSNGSGGGGRRRSVGGGPYFQQSEELVHNMANISSPSRSGSRWSQDEENQLIREIHSRRTFTEIARIHGRTVGAIEERADRLGLP